MSQLCQHATGITSAAGIAPPRDVCEACIEIGGTWVNLRQCLTCARTLCCNDSPNQHMTGHFRETGHPVMRGAGPGDAWTWCFVDEAGIEATADGWEILAP